MGQTEPQGDRTRSAASAPAAAPKPLISFLLVIRNEVQHVRLCLGSMLCQTLLPRLYEVIVVDGMSTDGTREAVREVIRENPERGIRVFDNPKKILAAGWNVGIREARGEFVVRPDAHAEVPPDFLERSLAVMNEHPEAWAVGGMLETVGRGFWGETIAAALSTHMATGGSAFRVGGQAGPADTVVYGLYRRSRLLQVGGFDEGLALNQDVHCHGRMRKLGGVLYFDSSIRSTYFARDSLGGLWRRHVPGGLWLVRMLKHGGPSRFSTRYLVPMFFVVSLVTLLGAGLIWPRMFEVLAAVLALYCGVGWLFAYRLNVSRLQKLVMPLVFGVRHTAFGVGSILGLISLSWYRPNQAFVWLQCPPEAPAASAAGEPEWPFISIVTPMYNEERFIEQFIEGIKAQDYPADRFEVLLVDGGSRDRTRPIAEEAARRDGRLRVLDNPERRLPQGENIGVRNARGEVIARMDVHAGYPPNYLRSCIEALRSTGVWCVGGILRTEPGADGPLARAIAVAQSHVFGVGNSQARVGKTARLVDSVAFPCLWRWVFERVGLYNELMPRHEDVELYSRIRLAGGRLMVVPSIRATYYSRPDLGSLLRQAWQNGYETPMAWLAARSCTRLRHWVPGIFVGSLIGAPIGYLTPWPYDMRFFLTLLMAYFLALFIACIDVGIHRGWALVPLVAPVFLLHHFSYGLGTLVGLLGMRKAYRLVKAYQTPVLEKNETLSPLQAPPPSG